MNETPNPSPLLAREFENPMGRTARVLGWIWLPIHIFALPVLLSLYVSVNPEELTEAGANLVYYAFSALVLLIVMFRYWKGGFETFLDRPGRCLLAMVLGFAANYALSLVISLPLVLILGEDLVNPNNEAVMDAAAREMGTIKAVTIFLAPVVEETLFRGVVFGSIRPKRRILAYVVSAALFCLLHVWQYVLVYGDAALLLYALQYIPASIAFAWCYERCGSIWAPILLHMALNAMSFAILA